MAPGGVQSVAFVLGRESSVELGVAGNNSCYREWPLKSICKRLFYDTGIVGGGVVLPTEAYREGWSEFGAVRQHRTSSNHCAEGGSRPQG